MQRSSSKESRVHVPIVERNPWGTHSTELLSCTTYSLGIGFHSHLGHVIKDTEQIAEIWIAMTQVMLVTHINSIP